MFFRKQPEPEPEIVVEKSEQLDGEIYIHIGIPDDGQERVFSKIKTVDGKISGISLGLESRGYVSDSFHPSMYSSVHFSSKELQALVKVLNAILTQIYFVEMAQD